MDYKEKYEKALEWMKSIYPTMQGSDKEDAEHYFPELAENEDEKIMDDIMVAVENWHTCERVEEIRSYLRKQKEQKPADGKELLYVSNKSYNIGYRDGKREAEQKPAEWSEEDERIRKDMLFFLEEQRKAGGLNQPNWIAWLKSLRPSWKPSEVHLSALLAIISDPDNIGSQTCQLALTDLYEQLKKL